MNRPSQFKTCKWPQNLFQEDCFFRNQIQERFLVSKSLIRQQNYNLHFGIDLRNNCQVVIASILEYKSQKNLMEETGTEYGSRLIWSGTGLLNKLKYFFKIYQKNGCLFMQFLSDYKISIQKLYVLLLMSLQLLCKIHKSKGNLNFFQLKSLQLVENITTGQIQFQIYGFSCFFIRNQFIEPNEKRNIRIENHKKKHSIIKQGYHQQPPNDKRDIKLILQKILQIKIKFYKQENQSETLKGNQFQKFIKKFIKEVDGFSQSQSKNSYRCYKIIQKLVNQLKININQQKFQIKKFIQKKNALNKQNLQHFCRYYNAQQFSNQLQLEEDSELESLTSQEDALAKTPIGQYIENHILQVKKLKHN